MGGREVAEEDGFVGCGTAKARSSGAGSHNGRSIRWARAFVADVVSASTQEEAFEINVASMPFGSSHVDNRG